MPYLPLNENGDPVRAFAPTLGRAFLQAALMGANYGIGLGWLAQAPGPGKGKTGFGFDPQELSATETTLDVEPGDTSFRDSWQDHWIIFGLAHSQPNDTTTSHSKDVHSRASIPENAVDVVVAVAIVVAIVVFVRRKKKRATKAAEVGNAREIPPDGSSVGPSEPEARRRSELETKEKLGGLTVKVGPQELSAK